MAEPDRSSGPLAGLDLDVARTLVAICESGNFSRAAERVHRTPSAISLQVKKLEGLVGRELFVREARTVTPTRDGEILLGYARKLLRLNDEAMAHFRIPPMEGRVRFGAPYDAGVLSVPAVLARFATTHPQVEVEVRLGNSRDLRRRCLAGDLDVVLFACDDNGSLPVEQIRTEALVWVGLKQGRAVHRRPLPLALADPGCSWRAAALAALEAAGISYRVAYSSEHCQGQIAAVQADLAVAPLPLSVVAPPFERLDGVEGLPSLCEYGVYMMRRDGAGPVGDALADHVAASFREITGRGARIVA